MSTMCETCKMEIPEGQDHCDYCLDPVANTISKDEIEFTVTAKLEYTKEGVIVGLNWFQNITHKSEIITDRFIEELWDQFGLDVEKEEG